MIKIRIMMDDGTVLETYPELNPGGLMSVCELLYDYRIYNEKIVSIDVIER